MCIQPKTRRREHNLKIRIIINTVDNSEYELFKDLKESESLEIFEKNSLAGLGELKTLGIRANDGYYVFKTSQIEAIVIQPIKE